MTEGTDRTEKIDMVLEIQLSIEDGSLSLEQAKALIDTLSFEKLTILKNALIKVREKFELEIVEKIAVYETEGVELLRSKSNFILDVVLYVCNRGKDILKKK